MTGFVLQGHMLLVIFKSLLLSKSSINTVITVYDILQFKITVFYYDILKMYFIPVIKAEFLALLIAPVSSHISSYCHFENIKRNSIY